MSDGAGTDQGDSVKRYRALPERIHAFTGSYGEGLGVRRTPLPKGPRVHGEESEYVRADIHEGAVEALKRYGFHDGDCPACLVDDPGSCDCGWDAVARQQLGGQ